MKRFPLACTCMLIAHAPFARSFENMMWFNEPPRWSASPSTLEFDVPANTDYWRISHYGFTVDDAPFLYAEYGGEFEAKVKISGNYKTRFDQAGMMIRVDCRNYIKAGIEYVGGKYNISVVVTHDTSDWSVIPLETPVKYIWIKAIRRRDAVEIFYSFDDSEYIMMRNAWMPDNCPVRVGVMAASPDGDGFKASFENLQVKHLPDSRRLEWLRQNTAPDEP